MNLTRRIRESSQIAPLSSLSSCVDINQGDEFFQTALHYAMRANDIDTVKTLMTGGADVEAGDLFKETPLHLAALIADYDVVLEYWKNAQISMPGRGLETQSCILLHEGRTIRTR